MTEIQPIFFSLFQSLSGPLLQIRRTVPELVSISPEAAAATPDLRERPVLPWQVPSCLGNVRHSTSPSPSSHTRNLALAINSSWKRQKTNKQTAHPYIHFDIGEGIIWGQFIQSRDKHANKTSSNSEVLEMYASNVK